MLDRTPVVELCTKVGIKVFRDTLDSDVRCKINFVSNDLQEVIVNKADSNLRQRFFIAKALAFRMKNKKATLVQADNSPMLDSSRDEELLNFQAVGVLMPLRRIEFLVNRVCGPDAQELARITEAPLNASQAALEDFLAWKALSKMCTKRTTPKEKECDMLGHAIDLGIGAAVGSIFPSFF